MTWNQLAGDRRLSNARAGAALAEELGVSPRYIQLIRAGYIPHPRHFEKLAKMAGVEMPR